MKLHLFADGGYKGPWEAWVKTSTGYSVVYHVEILLLFVTLIAIGPLVGRSATIQSPPPQRLGLAG